MQEPELRTQMRHFADQCVRIREKNGLTESEVARRMYTTSGHVMKLESNRADVRLSTLLRYADAIGATIEIHLQERHRPE
jgi:transcriptional regulator with XRE-family HTH domain